MIMTMDSATYTCTANAVDVWIPVSLKVVLKPALVISVIQHNVMFAPNVSSGTRRLRQKMSNDPPGAKKRQHCLQIHHKSN